MPAGRVLLLVLLLPAVLGAGQRHLHLAIGDPERKDREVPVTLDAVTDTRTGELLTPDELAERLAGVRLLFLGESHTDIEFHRAQLRVIEALQRAGREVMIGLEMFPYTRQQHLDDWIAGLTTEDGFLRFSRWYDSWSYHWGYYRDIFLYAREHGLRMFAVNTPREVVRAVREKGFTELTDEEAAHVPAEIDFGHAEHAVLFRSYFDEDDPLHAAMTEAQWDGMIRAQSTWDATMAYNSARALSEHGGETTIFVVLIGSGHVAYGLGVEHQARQWLDGTTASLIPVPVADDDGEPVTAVQASYADFIWGLPASTDPLWPSLGASTREIEGDVHRRVIHVGEGSAAEQAGFEVGDVLLTLDGADLVDKETLNRWLAGKRWGDRALFTVRRDEAAVTLEVLFRRRAEPPEPAVK